MAKRDNPFRKQPGILYPIAGGKADDGELIAEELVLCDAKMPKRKWVYGRDLIRGFVTVMAAPGGTGKSMLALAMLLSIAIGRNLLGAKLRLRQCNVLICSLEDPRDELDRRVLGIAQRFDITNAELKGRAFAYSGDRSLRMGSVEGDDVVFPDQAALVKFAKEHNIGVIAADPFSETHQLRESDNIDMVEVMKGWRAVARAAGCAVLLVHHERKGGGVATEAVRGAKAITDSARVVLRVSQMGDEGKAWNIAEDDRWEYLRIDNGKANLAPKHRVRWFHITSHDIGNGVDGEAGDTVPVPEAWKPPSLWAQFTVEQLNAALDHVARGAPDGTLYSDRKTGGDRWAGFVLMAELGVDEAQARTLIKAWMKSGLLTVVSYTDPKQRKERQGVRVDDSKRPGEAQ